jgi:predicted TIM-barrel fold metal-dependent hydrolase
MTLVACNSMAATMDLVYSGVFVRFPGLKVMLSEGGIGWMPYIIERADRMWQRHKGYDAGVDHGVLPSELIRRNIYGCFIDDDTAGLIMRDQIGVSQIVWESDYPHSDGTWPHSRKILAEVLQDVPDEDARRIVELNARELLHFDGGL